MKAIEAAAADRPLQRLYVDDNVGEFGHAGIADCKLQIADLNLKSSIFKLNLQSKICNLQSLRSHSTICSRVQW